MTSSASGIVASRSRGGTGSTVSTCRMMRTALSPTNGGVPTKGRRAPRPGHRHRSVAPAAGLRPAPALATYRRAFPSPPRLGQPRRVPDSRANPKSISTARGPTAPDDVALLGEVSMMFAGLISRWMMPSSCALCRA